MNFIGFIFPPRCAVCRKVLPQGAEAELCSDCEKELPRITGPRCRICGRPMNGSFAMPWCADCAKGRPFERCFVPFRYKGAVRRLIVGAKYYGHPGRCRFLAGEIAAALGDFRPDAITYVPQSRSTDRSRGYNQTRLIARELGKRLNVPVRGVLRRKAGGLHQVGLTEARRKLNAKKLYLPGKERLSGTWLLVDDVTTTGATLDACCRILKGMGCERVFAAAAAVRMKGDTD